MRKIIQEVESEMRRQDEKWGQQDHCDYYWMGILVEEVGESAKAMIENAVRSYVGVVTHDADGPIKVNVVVDRPGNLLLRKELLHVAAVVMQWILCIDRRESAQDETSEH